jgi:hypothetical protein
MNTQRDNPITDDELILLACDELDESRANEVRAALAGDPELAAQLRGLDQTVAALRADVDGSVAGDFNERLRRRVSEESAESIRRARPARITSGRWARWLPAMAAVAAVLVLAAIVLPPLGKHDAAVAWADVVRAVGGVSQFHATVFGDEPRNAHSPKMFRIDLFYKSPDTWRAQGLDHVQFLHNGTSQLWDVEKQRFVTPSENPTVPSLVPDDFIQAYNAGGMMPAILNTLFDGKPPAGEPVKSDAATAGDGVEVFDYARDARTAWARIWVLKQSRLPIRMSLYQPYGDDTMVVTFDYSDPQPDRFFDAGAFSKEVGSLGLTDAHRVYTIGTEPVNNKPRSSDQIFQVQGGYKAARVLRAEANEQGDIKLVTDNIRNTPPAGVNLLQDGFASVTDSWGNTYVMVTAFWPPMGGDGEAQWYFAPAPPLRHGDGPLVVLLKYAVVESRNGPVGDKVIPLGERTITIDKRVSGYPGDWDSEVVKDRQLSLANYLRRTATLQDQLTFLDAWQAQDPQSLDALLWRLDLLKNHGRTAAASELFETRIRAMALQQPFHYEAMQAMSAYLFGLARDGHVDQVKPIADQLRQAWQNIKGTPQETRLAPNGQYLYENSLSSLRAALHIPDALAEFERGPRPSVARVVAARNGRVFVDIELPSMPADAEEYFKYFGGATPLNYWGSPQLPKDSGWGVECVLTNRVGHVQMVLAGHGATIPLIGNATVVPNFQDSLTQRWPIDVQVPEATVDDVYAAGLVGPNAQPPATGPSSPLLALRQSADESVAQGRFADAADAFAKILADPAAAELSEDSRRDIRIELAKCFAHVGRFDDVDRTLTAIEAALPAEVHPDDYQELHVREAVRSVRLGQVRELMREHKLADARAMLDRLEAGRPDLRRVSDHMIFTPLPGGGMTNWIPRSENQRAWRAFDAVKWDLLDSAGR